MALPGDSTLFEEVGGEDLQAHRLPPMLRCCTPSLKHPAEQLTSPLAHGGELQIPSWSILIKLCRTQVAFTHLNSSRNLQLQAICRNMEDNVIIRLLHYQVIGDY